MNKRLLLLLTLLGIGSLLTVCWLWTDARLTQAQVVAHELEISPLMKRHGDGLPVCTSIYTVTKQTSLPVFTWHQFHDRDDRSIHDFADTIEDGPSRGYNLADIDELSDGYTGYVVVQSDHPLTYLLDACSERPPTASFTATPTVGLAPLAVQFTATYTWAVPAQIWSPGDGTIVTNTAAFTHTYARGRRYISQLTVANASGRDTAQLAITVGDWEEWLDPGDAFTRTFTADGFYTALDPTTGHRGKVHVNAGGGSPDLLATATVTVTSGGFTPPCVQVRVGDVVRWLNADTEPRHLLGWGPEQRLFLPLIARELELTIYPSRSIIPPTRTHQRIGDDFDR